MNTDDPAGSRVPSPVSTSSTDSEAEEAAGSRRRHYITILITCLAGAIIQYSSGLYDRQDYHTSALSGHAWVLELLTGHPEHIWHELGVQKHVFDKLIIILQELGHGNSQEVTLEEQLSIFLYTCVTGLLTRHVGERFQWANSTIAKYVI